MKRGLVLATTLVVAACSAGQRAPTAEPTPRPAPAAQIVAQNVTRADYAGSAACAPCHGELVARWERSPMHRMTRREGAVPIASPFDGRTFRFKDDSATLESHGGARFVRVASAQFGDALYRVTKVIGGRVREDFAGVRVTSVDAPIAAHPRDEVILPLTHVLATGELRYKGYSVQARERPGLRAGPVWSKTCIFCHNTVPLLDASLGDLAVPRASGFQGSSLDALLPAVRQRPFRVLDDAALVRALGDEVRALGSSPAARTVPEALREAIATTRASFDDEDVIEVGIGCESCHGGARAHVASPSVKPSFAARAPFLAQAPMSDAEAENRACGRCHQVLFSQYPWTYEGGERRGAHPGGSTINSGEARDFLLGGCASAMRCSTCHDPHARDGAARGRDLATKEGDRICLSCHQKYDGSALAAHTHHRAEGQGSRCVACHMPRKTMGLDGTLGRYHRIGSPTDAARVLGDRPLECALCHEGAKVSTLVSAMERWWGKSYDRAALRALYGDLDDEAVRATLARGKPHEQAVAIALLAGAGRRDASVAIGQQLMNPVPLVRYWARDALVRLRGEGARVNLHQDTAAIERETAAWLGHAAPPPARAHGEADDEE